MQRLDRFFYVMMALTILLHFVLIIRQGSIKRFAKIFFVGHFKGKDIKIFMYCELMLALTIILGIFHFKIL